MKLKKILPPSFSAPLDWSLCLWDWTVLTRLRSCPLWGEGCEARGPTESEKQFVTFAASGT